MEAELSAAEDVPDQRTAAVADPVVAAVPAAQSQAEPGVPADSAKSHDTVDAGPEPEPEPEQEPEQEPVAVAETETAADRCVRVGPLTVDEAQALRTGLAAVANVVAEERREIPVVDGYYVLIPPLASRQAGSETLDRLSAAGVKDTWLFRSGELRNAISLGYFKREASAVRHAETIRDLGFEVEVREKPVQVERLWLLIARSPESDAAAVTDQAPTGAASEPVDCPAD